MKKYLAAFILILCLTSVAFEQANGKLQIHFIDVGQGGAAILISPKGETILFDNGVAGYCDLPVSYLMQIGITKIDYHIASHYHADHIGCTPQVLKAGYDIVGKNIIVEAEANKDEFTVRYSGSHIQTPILSGG